MVRLPQPGGDTGNWGNILNDFLSLTHNPDGTLKDVGIVAAKAEDTEVVHKVGNETVGGIKTFSNSPLVPSPTTSNQAANKTYVDNVATAGAPDATTSNKGIVQLAGDLAGTATSPQIAAGAIVDADVSTSAAIAQSKIANLTTDLASRETPAGAQAKVDTHSADTIVVHGIADTSVLETTAGSQAKVDTHINDTADAHDASAISFVPTATIAATDVQAAIAEVAGEAGSGTLPTNLLYRLLESSGTYPTRPATGYVDFLGPTDPGVLLLPGDTWTQTPPPATLPGSPTGLAATGGNTSATLTWTAPASNGGSAITDYAVQFKLSTEPTTWTTFSDAVSAVTGATVTGLTNGSAYNFRVAAVNAVGTGPVSNVATATPATNLLRQSASDQETTLEWENNIGSTVALSTAQFHSGSQSVEITSVAGGQTGIKLKIPWIAATAGTNYQLKLWIRIAADRFPGVIMRFASNTDAFLGISQANPVPSANTWTEVTTSGVAPVGTTMIWVLVDAFSLTVSETYYIDDVTVVAL